MMKSFAAILGVALLSLCDVSADIQCMHPQYQVVIDNHSNQNLSVNIFSNYGGGANTRAPVGNGVNPGGVQYLYAGCGALSYSVLITVPGSRIAARCSFANLSQNRKIIVQNNPNSSNKNNIVCF